MTSSLSSQHSHSLIQAYQNILQEDPTHWTIYPQLAKHMPTSLEKSHVFLRGAWEALHRQEYKTSQDLATKAHQADPSRFSFYLIDLELLRAQNKPHLIPSKLQEIGRLFEEKALPAQAVKAYKRHARLLPSIDTYEKVISLYTQAGKQAKALEWTRQLAKLKPASASKEPPERKEAPASSSQPLHPPVPAFAFGKAAWEEYIGSVGAEPPLPPDINEILQGPCPFWPDKKIQETHLLVLIPETVNGKSLTLKSLGELVKKPLKGHPTQYRDRSFKLGEYCDPPAPKSHWTLLTTNVIPGSRNKMDTPYQDQQALIETYNQKSGVAYQVPNVLDVAVSLFMHHIRTENRLYPDIPWTFTRCQEKCNKDSQLAVGSFAREGLVVSYDYFGNFSLGVGGLLKFPSEALDGARQLTKPKPIPKGVSDSKEAPAHSLQLSRPPVPAFAFGKAAWEEYIGPVGAEPPLPPDIDQILKSPCLFWKGRLVQYTHLLVLIPETVNGKPLTLKSLGELVKKPLKGNPTQYQGFYLGQYGDPPAPKSHWALLTTDVIPRSVDKSYKDQQALVQAYNKKSRLPYQVPNVLDVAVCLFMHHIRTGNRLYTDSPWIYTRCQEKYDETYQLAVGVFARAGLDVRNVGKGFVLTGVGGLLKFPSEALDGARQLVKSKPVFEGVSESKEAPAHPLQLSRPPVPALAFGKAVWEEYIGSVGAEPPLPPDITQILQSPCPFWKDRKVQETHLLVLIPETVNGKPLTLKNLGELVQKPLKGHSTKYKAFYLGEYQDPPPTSSHWALLTTGVVPGSRNKSYKDQRALIETYCQKSGLPYQVPNLLDTTVCLFMHHICTGNYFYPDNPRTCTRCEEKHSEDFQLLVGSFSRSGKGLYIIDACRGDANTIGIGALRKFS